MGQSFSPGGHVHPFPSGVPHTSGEIEQRQVQGQALQDLQNRCVPKPLKSEFEVRQPEAIANGQVAAPVAIAAPGEEVRFSPQPRTDLQTVSTTADYYKAQAQAAQPQVSSSAPMLSAPAAPLTLSAAPPVQQPIVTMLPVSPQADPSRTATPRPTTTYVSPAEAVQSSSAMPVPAPFAMSRTRSPVARARSSTSGMRFRTDGSAFSPRNQVSSAPSYPQPLEAVASFAPPLESSVTQFAPPQVFGPASGVIDMMPAGATANTDPTMFSDMVKESYVDLSTSTNRRIPPARFSSMAAPSDAPATGGSLTVPAPQPLGGLTGGSMNLAPFASPQSLTGGSMRITPGAMPLSYSAMTASSRAMPSGAPTNSQPSLGLASSTRGLTLSRSYVPAATFGSSSAVPAAAPSTGRGNSLPPSHVAPPSRGQIVHSDAPTSALLPTLSATSAPPQASPMSIAAPAQAFPSAVATSVLVDAPTPAVGSMAAPSHANSATRSASFAATPALAASSMDLLPLSVLPRSDSMACTGGSALMGSTMKMPPGSMRIPVVDRGASAPPPKNTMSISRPDLQRGTFGSASGSVRAAPGALLTGSYAHMPEYSRSDSTAPTRNTAIDAMSTSLRAPATQSPGNSVFSDNRASVESLTQTTRALLDRHATSLRASPGSTSMLAGRPSKSSRLLEQILQDRANERQFDRQRLPPQNISRIMQQESLTRDLSPTRRVVLEPPPLTRDLSPMRRTTVEPALVRDQSPVRNQSPIRRTVMEPPTNPAMLGNRARGVYDRIKELESELSRLQHFTFLQAPPPNAQPQFRG